MPTALDVIRRKAHEAHAQQKLLVAEEHYRTLLEKEANIDDVINLGALLRSQGRLKEGSLFYEYWIKQFTDDSRLVLNACNCWNDNNQAQLSLEYIEKFSRSPNCDKQLRICYADSLYKLNKLQECCEVLRECKKEDPSNKEIHKRFGLALAKSGKLDEALESFKEANKIDSKDLEVNSNIITILKDLGRFREGEELFEKLTSEEKLDVDIAQSRANLLMAQNKLTEASKIYQYICRKRPNNANYWLNWAATLRGLRHTVAPMRILKRALCYSPFNKDVQEALLQIFAEMSNDRSVERCINTWPKDDESFKDIYLFNRQFLGIGTIGSKSEYLLDQAQRWEINCQSKFENNLWLDTIPKPLKNRKLRIGYLSADLANHPVGRFLLPVLSNHNKDEVEIWALSCGSHDDWITNHIRDNVDHWVDLRFISMSESARIIADIGLDVLVELGGFSANSPLEVLCYKPAPVQLSYLGYPGPTYLKCIDGWIGDSVLFGNLDPIDHNVHKLIEIDGGYMVFDTGGELPTPKRTAGSRFRFGSFNHARKLTDATIDLFCDVMAANPETELVLKSISFCEDAEKQRIRGRFEKRGLESKRLNLLDWVEGGINHLELYSEVDVALDPIPYGGATTTAEALWMGVPVLTLAGKGMVGRLAASLLIHGNQTNLVSYTKEEFIRKATDLAMKGPRGEDVRSQLRIALQQSPLSDGKRLSQKLEDKYRELRNAVK